MQVESKTPIRCPEKIEKEGNPELIRILLNKHKKRKKRDENENVRD